MQSSSHLSSYLPGKTAAITGGAGELCGAMAEELAGLGVTVAIVDIDSERADKKARFINDSGGKALGMGADVTSLSDMAALAERIRSELGGLHILVNGAGGNHPEATTSQDRSFFDLPIETLKKVFELNCIGVMLPCQVLGRIILETVEKSGDVGNIINISSMNAFRPLSRIPAYSAAKAAVSNFTQWLAVHIAREYTPKLRVNAIAPGFFLTDQNRFLLVEDDTGEYTARGKTILDHSPAGRFGRADDLISALLWLLDPKSSFVNGVVVPVDGGFNAFSGV